MSPRRSDSPSEPLGGHVAQGARDVAGCGHVPSPSSHLARPKSVTQALPSGVEQQVRRLDVAMQDAQRVRHGPARRPPGPRSGRPRDGSEPDPGRSDVPPRAEMPPGCSGDGRPATRRIGRGRDSDRATVSVEPGLRAPRRARTRPSAGRGPPIGRVAGGIAPRRAEATLGPARSRRTSSITRSSPWPGMYCMT